MELLIELFGELFVEVLAASAVQRKRQKRLRAFALYQRAKKSKRSNMKNTDLSPYIGLNIEVFDALGNCIKGILKDVTDTTAVVLDKKHTKSIISLDFITRAVVSEGIY